VTKKFAVLLLSLLALAATAAMAGSKNPMVGGQEMYPTKDIIDNAGNSADHNTLVAAVKAAGLVDHTDNKGYGGFVWSKTLPYLPRGVPGFRRGK
jgi:uncharacterized surface protein with fasciclin (FAS1) repeats